jgi:HEPN domain-containing protein
MLTNLAFLSEAQRKQLAQLVTLIVKAISPEKIICFGSRSTVMQGWSCFLPGDGCRETVSITYYLLIITNADEKRAEHELIQIIEQQAGPLTCGVTSIVHKLVSVNEAIEKGHRFFTTLHHKGILLYNGKGSPLSGPPEDLPPAAVKRSIEESWNREFAMAEKFYHAAAYCLSSGWNELSVFLLHQSVEHGCIALLRAITGYRPHTHNLSRLLALTENFSLMPSGIFPATTKVETDLFNLLRNAYSDARYNEDYSVPAEKAAILAARVKQLLETVEQLYREKPGSLNNQPFISFPLAINDVREKNK